jgi:lipopolysaccharide transport system ATP-binding protein
MSDPQVVIKVEDVSKRYRLGVIGGATLSDELSGWWAKVRGKQNPNLIIGDEEKAVSDGKYFMALNDINFEVKQGEILGIIGKNGAGKSTLLKLLSQITLPSSGSIKMKGRTASLLEVGTGFHPELTGRENIFLNGAILGMTKPEINSKLEEIIDFSGIKHHIDTPVKRYSSGMKVRLGFAIAAHLEPEILIIDEVLAVGDAEFQRKCIGKMQDVAGHGRTVLFVSHNMVSVKNLCTRGMMLKDGRVNMVGGVDEVVSAYIMNNYDDDLNSNYFEWPDENEAPGNDDIKIRRAAVKGDGGKEIITMNQALSFEIDYDIKTRMEGLNFTIHVINQDDVTIFGSGTLESPDTLMKEHEEGKYCSVCHIPSDLMNSGFYKINLLAVKGGRVLFKLRDFLTFEIVEGDLEGRANYKRRVGLVRPKLKWNTTVTV